jgi:hypothetical protein
MCFETLLLFYNLKSEMDYKTVTSTTVVSLHNSLVEATYNYEAKEPSTLSIKARIALLNGAFPMDKAVIRGTNIISTYWILEILKVGTRLTCAASQYLALPKGSIFLSVEHFATSVYAITGRLLARNPDGTETLYFLKVSLLICSLDV